MKKNLYIFLSLLFVTALSFTACSDDDKKPKQVSEEWIDFQKEQVEIFKLRSGMTEKVSLSGNGSIFYVASDSLQTRLTKMTQDGKPQFSDSVLIRYQGWFYDLDNNRRIFDYGSEANPNSYNPKWSQVDDVIDGYATMLQEMVVGQEVLLCIPQALGYRYHGDSRGQVAIPGYTTLFFSLQLLEIKPSNKTEVESWS